MADKCVEDLKSAVEAVKDAYGDDPKWKSVIEHGEEAVKAADSAESPAPESPGQKAANEVRAEENKPEEKQESPEHENSESPKTEDEEHPKDMKGAAKIALLMLRNKK
jgi:hypothetical protein